MAHSCFFFFAWPGPPAPTMRVGMRTSWTPRASGYSSRSVSQSTVLFLFSKEYRGAGRFPSRRIRGRPSLTCSSPFCCATGGLLKKSEEYPSAWPLVNDPYLSEKQEPANLDRHSVVPPRCGGLARGIRLDRRLARGGFRPGGLWVSSRRDSSVGCWHPRPKIEDRKAIFA